LSCLNRQKQGLADAECSIKTDYLSWRQQFETEADINAALKLSHEIEEKLKQQNYRDIGYDDYLLDN
jgi:hypothetical protein